MRWRTPTGLLLILALAGCETPGDRAGGPFSEGACPAGETCSSKTPNGLYIWGPGLFDAWFGHGMFPTAVGGTQTLTVGGSSGAAYTGYFTAEIENDSTVALVGVLSPSVEVRGAAPGSTRLRLRDIGTTELLDRFTIEAAEVAAIEVTPRFGLCWPASSPAVLAGADVAVGVRLKQGDTRLVDESVTLASPSVALKKVKWDSYVLRAESPGAVPIVATSGGGAFLSTLDVVSQIDGLARNDGCTTAGTGWTKICFDALSAGRPVAGATWEFSVSAGFTAEPWEENCRILGGKAGATAALTVTASGFTKVFEVPIPTGSTPMANWTATTSAAPGERAASQAPRP